MIQIEDLQESPLVELSAEETEAINGGGPLELIHKGKLKPLSAESLSE